MEPLNITSSIAGIITAASQVSQLIGQIKDAPKSITVVANELDHIPLIFRALQKFLDGNNRVSGERAALIQLEDVVVILTQTVLVFSELESLISPIANGNKTTYLVRLTWERLQGGVMRLVNQLQRHKTLLALLLQIIQCESNFQALEASADFQRNIENVVLQDSDLSRRLNSLQLITTSIADDGTFEDDNGSADVSDSISGPVTKPESSLSSPEGVSMVPECKAEEGESSNSQWHFRRAPKQDKSFDMILATTRVYSRAKNGDIYHFGYHSELVRFPHIASPSLIGVPQVPLIGDPGRGSLRDPSDDFNPSVKVHSVEFRKVYDLLPWEGVIQETSDGLKRLQKEFSNLTRDPLSSCSAGPVGDNLFCGKGQSSDHVLGPASKPGLRGTLIEGARKVTDSTFNSRVIR